MRILFHTRKRDAPSAQINAPNLARLGEVPGVEIDLFDGSFSDYDVVLFMGYDPQVARVREANPEALVGIVDPRPFSAEQVRGADFVVTNGLEMEDWAARHCSNIYVYPIYPRLDLEPRRHHAGDRLVLCYHGNLVHLHTMFPHISSALEALGRDRPVELRAIYNLERLGPPTLELFDPNLVSLRLFQWSETAYEDHFADADIGILPNLIPIGRPSHAKETVASPGALFGEHESDYLVRYKCTSNFGRGFVFAQLGLPVVADMFPSAAQVIRQGHNGFLACGAAAWYRALSRLAESPELRQRLADNMLRTFREHFAVDILNRELVRFIRELRPALRLPAVLEEAQGRLDALLTHREQDLRKSALLGPLTGAGSRLEAAARSLVARLLRSGGGRT